MSINLTPSSHKRDIPTPSSIVSDFINPAIFPSRFSEPFVDPLTELGTAAEIEIDDEAAKLNRFVPLNPADTPSSVNLNVGHSQSANENAFGTSSSGDHAPKTAEGTTDGYVVQTMTEQGADLFDPYKYGSPEPYGNQLWDHSGFSGGKTVGTDIFSRGTYTLGNSQTDFYSHDHFTSKTVRGGSRFDIKEYYIYSGIIGNDLDNVLYGFGWLSRYGQYYYHDDYIYGGKGNDTISGGSGNDTLVGGEGSNYILGGSGNDVLDGRAGMNDTLVGGTGSDTIYGGTGNDLIMSGQTKGGEGNKLYGGAGADTFVLGDIPVDPVNEKHIDYAGFFRDFGVGTLNDWIDVSFTVFGWSKVLKEFAPMTIDLLNAFLKLDKTEITETPPTTEYNIIGDFNPIEDVIIIPLNASGDYNINIIEAKNGNADLIIQNVRDDGTVEQLGSIEWADVVDIFGADSGVMSMGGDARDGFIRSLLDSILIVDSAGATLGGSREVDLPADQELLDSLGTGRFMVLGAYAGRVIEEGDNKYAYGTNHGDIFAGFYFDNTSGSGAFPHLSENNEFWGFGGDDIFYGGAGSNIFFGGDGDDTAAYEFSLRGIIADLSVKHYDILNGAYYYTVENGFGEYDVDWLFDIANIVGSSHGDLIIGGDEANTFWSGDGDDTLMGGGGADHFIIDGGGTNTILDYSLSEGDRLTINISDFGSSEFRDINYRFVGTEVHIYLANTMVVALQNPNGELAGREIGVELAYQGQHVYYEAGGQGDDNLKVKFDRQGLILGGDGKDTINGGANDDSLYGGEGNDLIHGHAGNDYIVGDAGKDVIFGGSGNDTVEGGSGNDLIHGDAGDDHLSAGNGNDTVYGGTGNDTLFGNAGTNHLDGGDGDDHIHGGTDGAANTIHGGNGHDKIYAGYGQDSVFGGNGNDEIWLLGDGSSFVDGGAGDDAIFGGKGHDTLLGGSGNNLIDAHHNGTGGGNNVLTGGSGSDTLIGGTGNDTLEGQHGRDYYFSTGGDNVFIGGGTGEDVFVFDGGTTTVKNYTFGDRLYVDYDAYGIDSYLDLWYEMVPQAGGETYDTIWTVVATGEVVAVIEEMSYEEPFLSLVGWDERIMTEAW